MLYPTWSPENNFLSDEFGRRNSLGYGASYDQQFVYNLFTDCIEASIILNIDEDFREDLKSTIPKLCPQKIGQHGQLQEWPDDFDKADDTHRHISHLIALHAGRDISLLTNTDLAKAAHTTMVARCLKPQGGWATAWRSSLWARLFDGNSAHALYSKLTTNHTTDNLYAGSRHFQIDGNFGGPAAVCEMLMQSHLRSIDNNSNNIKEASFNAYVSDPSNPSNFHPVVPDYGLVSAPYIIHLLPALPEAWPDGKVSGLRARGGFEVDIEWKKGQLISAEIHAITGGDFRIYANDSLSAKLSLDKGETFRWKP